ncbi:MAG: hypothetical protein Q8O04_05670 [Deltaproteobacteria bacterium]|nr:hypothetical protein [Deltaproteobacteria bacterium]
MEEVGEEEVVVAVKAGELKGESSKLKTTNESKRAEGKKAESGELKKLEVRSKKEGRGFPALCFFGGLTL